MKTTIESRILFADEGNNLSVRLEAETLTDGSTVYNVVLTLFDIRLPHNPRLINHDCTCKAEATTKYDSLVKALDGFELS